MAIMKPGELPPLRDHEIHQLNVLSMMVRKLGGEAIVSSKEMEESGELYKNLKQYYEPSDGSFIWQVKERDN